MFRTHAHTLSVIWFSWLVVPADAKTHKITIPNAGQLHRITCVANYGSARLEKGVVSYEVGVVLTDEQTTGHTKENMHEAAASFAIKHGFSKMTSMTFKASYKYQHKDTSTQSKMTSVTTSHKLKLDVPELEPQTQWCAYQLQTSPFETKGNGQAYFMFQDLIITTGPIGEYVQEGQTNLEIVGEKQTWDNRRGYLLYTEKWGGGDNGWFMYMQDNGPGNVRGWGGDPGYQGHMVLKKVGDYYLMSTRKWRDWYVYMQDNREGNVRGWTDPGPQGHFIIKPHPYKSCYLISTKKWPSWYVYMQDVGDGNIRGWEGDPGPQGCWQMKLAYTGSEL